MSNTDATMVDGVPRRRILVASMAGTMIEFRVGRGVERRGAAGHRDC
jgi:hypothetical protein